MIVTDNYLFSKSDLFNVLRNQISSVQNEVDSISKDQFISNSDDQIAEYIYSKMEIVPLVIYPDRAVLSGPREIRLNRQHLFGHRIHPPGVETELSLPYTGESDLWECRPSSFSSVFPRGDVIPQRGNEQTGTLKIKFQYQQGDFQDDIVNQEIAECIASINKYLGWIKRDVEAHNQQLKNEVLRSVKLRRERLVGILDVLKTLDIPIQKRDGVPNFTELAIHRKHIEPLSSKQKTEPSYAISDNNYNTILDVIRHEGITFERTPKTYAVHNEEELRDILLAHLNGYFKGQAAGETFRKKGKTDILIEFENRAAFVAECKLWKGDKKLPEAIDQLLGYLTWRDVKSALIIFDKDVAGFQKIQEKIPGILRNHPNCLSVEAVQGGTEWKMVLRSQEDLDRLVTVQVFIFNLFVAKSS